MFVRWLETAAVPVGLHFVVKAFGDAVMPLLRVKRHMQPISGVQVSKVWPNGMSGDNFGVRVRLISLCYVRANEMWARLSGNRRERGHDRSSET